MAVRKRGLAWTGDRGITAARRFRVAAGGRTQLGRFPLRLFAKGNAKFWDPRDLDFSQDVADWADLNSEQQRSTAYLVTHFAAGGGGGHPGHPAVPARDGRREPARRRDVSDAVLLRGGQAHPGVPAVDGRGGTDRRPAAVRRGEPALPGVVLRRTTRFAGGSSNATPPARRTRSARASPTTMSSRAASP